MIVLIVLQKKKAYITVYSFSATSTFIWIYILSLLLFYWWQTFMQRPETVIQLLLFLILLKYDHNSKFIEEHFSSFLKGFYLHEHACSLLLYFNQKLFWSYLFYAIFLFAILWDFTNWSCFTVIFFICNILTWTCSFIKYTKIKCVYIQSHWHVII